MSEVAFAKQLLTVLDKRPIKLPADHVSDPRTYPSQSPFILPRNSHSFPRRDEPTSTQQAKEQTITATLKPMRAGETVTISDITLNTTVHDLKSQYAERSGQPLDKIKVLLNKKPAADLKTLKELGIDGNAELSVMIMGATTPAVEKADPIVPPPETLPTDKMDIDEKAPGPGSEKAQAQADATPTGADTAVGILKTDAFWTDLRSYLVTRLRDEQEGDKLVKVFREAWSKQR